MLTCRAMMLDLARMRRAVRTVLRLFQPWNNFLLLIMDWAKVVNSGSSMGLFLFVGFRPGWNVQASLL